MGGRPQTLNWMRGYNLGLQARATTDAQAAIHQREVATVFYSGCRQKPILENLQRNLQDNFTRGIKSVPHNANCCLQPPPHNRCGYQCHFSMWRPWTTTEVPVGDTVVVIETNTHNVGRPHQEQTHQTGQPRWAYWALHLPVFPTWCHPPRHRGNCLPNPGPGPSH